MWLCNKCNKVNNQKGHPGICSVCKCSEHRHVERSYVSAQRRLTEREEKPKIKRKGFMDERTLSEVSAKRVRWRPRTGHSGEDCYVGVETEEGPAFDFVHWSSWYGEDHYG